MRENVEPLHRESDYLITSDTEKAEVLYDFFVSIFTDNYWSHNIQVTEGNGWVQENGEAPIVQIKSANT